LIVLEVGLMREALLGLAAALLQRSAAAAERLAWAARGAAAAAGEAGSGVAGLMGQSAQQAAQRGREALVRLVRRVTALGEGWLVAGAEALEAASRRLAGGWMDGWRCCVR
jgi:hypothetical protein